MLRGDAAVDKTDDDIFTVQALGATQTVVGVEQLQEIQAVGRCQGAYFVFPDAQHLRQAFEFMRLGRVHLRSKSVQAELVTMHQLCAGAGTRKNPVLHRGQLCRVALHCRGSPVETQPFTDRCRGGAGRAQGFRRVHGRRRRRNELDDIDLAGCRILAAGEANGAEATRISQAAVNVGGRGGCPEHDRQQQGAQNVHLRIDAITGHLCG